MKGVVFINNIVITINRAWGSHPQTAAGQQTRREGNSYTEQRGTRSRTKSREWVKRSQLWAGSAVLYFTPRQFPLQLNSAFRWKGKTMYPCNRPWRPIGLWDVEAPTFSRQSAHWWRWGCQPYALAALYPQQNSWYSFLLEAESTPES
jgi:hypothetical protein